MRYLFTAAIAFTLWSLGASQKAGECVVKCNSMKLDVLTLEICRYIQGSISVRHIFIYFILIWIRPYSKHILHGLLLSREAKKTLPRPKVGDFCSVAMEQGFSDACVPLCLGNTPYTVHCDLSINALFIFYDVVIITHCRRNTYSTYCSGLSRGGYWDASTHRPQVVWTRLSTRLKQHFWRQVMLLLQAIRRLPRRWSMFSHPPHLPHPSMSRSQRPQSHQLHAPYQNLFPSRSMIRLWIWLFMKGKVPKKLWLPFVRLDIQLFSYHYYFYYNHVWLQQQQRLQLYDYNIT